MSTRAPFRGFSSTTQLTRAAYNGDLQQLRMLLELGADANARDGGGRSALYWCASGGHVDAMRALLDRGADVSLTDKSGWPALLKAAGMGQDEAVALLLERGADVRAQLPAGSYFFASFNALDLARRGKHDAVAVRLEAALAAAATAEGTAGTIRVADQAPPRQAPPPLPTEATRAPALRASLPPLLADLRAAAARGQ